MCVFSAEKVLDSCSFRDEDDDCTYYYTVESPKELTDKDLEVRVRKKKGELQLGYVSHMLCALISVTTILSFCNFVLSAMFFLNYRRYTIFGYFK